MLYLLEGERFRTEQQPLHQQLALGPMANQKKQGSRKEEQDVVERERRRDMIIRERRERERERGAS
jgi:nitric oxide reductase activation protein